MAVLVRSPQQLAAALRRLRHARNLTQMELAQRAGVRQSTISLIENGQLVRFDTMMDLLRALDLELVIQPRSKSSHEDIEALF